MKPGLLLDLYELTMVAGYFRRGMHERQAVFELYFRENPFHGGYAVFAGLGPALAHLENLRFDEPQIRYLHGLGLFDERFLSYLESFRFRGTVTAPAEGEVVFAGEPMLSVEGNLGQCQLVETSLLNFICFQTLIATKTARIVREAGEATVVEFGARRAHGPDGALSATRAAFVGGARKTSHLGAGRAFDIPVSGTQAHSWIMAFRDELEAFRAYAEIFPDDCVLLVDTYDTLLSGVPNAITVARELSAAGHALRGIRLDSGDLAALSIEARRMLDGAGFPDVQIVASNDLDEQAIRSLRRRGARIDLYGVGTRLVTAAGPGGGSLGGVYKLVELDGEPRIKVSADPGKTSWPGRKRLWRIVDGEGPSLRYIMDLLARPEESSAGSRIVYDQEDPDEELRLPEGARMEAVRSIVMRGGRATEDVFPLEVCAERARVHLARLPEGCLRLEEPERYRLAVTRGVREQFRALLRRVSVREGTGEK